MRVHDRQNNGQDHYYAEHEQMKLQDNIFKSKGQKFRWLAKNDNSDTSKTHGVHNIV